MAKKEKKVMTKEEKNRLGAIIIDLLEPYSLNDQRSLITDLFASYETVGSMLEIGDALLKFLKQEASKEE